MSSHAPASAPRTLKLGTRRSLLAWAQSSWVARTVESHHPHVKVELVGIETQGDKILDKPLSQIDGKEFFTAELDLALLEGHVDFTVHSMKDLSLDRPASLILAATPPRELPHDVIVFHSSVISRLEKGEEIRIGTSSPRRLTLIPAFLKTALPRFGNEPIVRFVEIRGNVNTRLSRIHEPANSERKLDGVVLAFAGLERLALGEASNQELWRLLENTRFMIPPLAECPTAPAQGALAIETRRDNTEVFQLLRALHDAETLKSVSMEREILQEWGGGCHQKLGATYSRHHLFIRGTKPDGTDVSEVRAPAQNSASDYLKVEPTDLFDFEAKSLTASETSELEASPFVFVAHSRAFDFLSNQSLREKRVWVSGTKTWKKLAAAGVWVEGSVESQGFKAIQHFAEKKLLRMLDQPMALLTHDESTPHTAPHIKVKQLATYTHHFRSIPATIAQASKLYWSSSLPFETVWKHLDETGRSEFLKKRHASGSGRTSEVLKAHGIQAEIVSQDSLRKVTP